MPRNEFTCDCNIIHKDIIDFVRAGMLTDERFSKISSFFKAIGDATRFRILWAISRNEMCVCDIANLMSMSKSAVSHQLGFLRREGLVKCRKDGKTVYYSPADELVRHILQEAVMHIDIS